MKLLALAGLLTAAWAGFSAPPAAAQDHAPVHHAVRRIRHRTRAAIHHMRAAEHRAVRHSRTYYRRHRRHHDR